MNLSPVLVLLLISLVGISGLYFLRGRRLTLVRRIAASVHGLLVLLTLPIAGVVAAKQLQPESVMVILAVYGCPALAIVSMVYSVRALRELGYLHFLHILTFAGLLATNLMAALLIVGPG